jgi:hypothetical protein
MKIQMRFSEYFALSLLHWWEHISVSTAAKPWLSHSLISQTKYLNESLTLPYTTSLMIQRIMLQLTDRLCGLVARVCAYRSGGPGFDSRRFQIFWEAAGRSRKPRLTAVGIRCADHPTPSIRKSWHYFSNKRRSLGRDSSLAEQSHGV